MAGRPTLARPARAPPTVTTGARRRCTSTAGGSSRAARRLAPRLSVLNVSHVDLRADGHVSGAGALYADGAAAAWGRFCSDW
eukprot:3230436-Prymnesium_polylepis.1